MEGRLAGLDAALDAGTLSLSTQRTHQWPTACLYNINSVHTSTKNYLSMGRVFYRTSIEQWRSVCQILGASKTVLVLNSGSGAPLSMDLEEALYKFWLIKQRLTGIWVMLLIGSIFSGHPMCTSGIQRAQLMWAHSLPFLKCMSKMNTPVTVVPINLLKFPQSKLSGVMVGPPRKVLEPEIFKYIPCLKRKAATNSASELPQHTTRKQNALSPEEKWNLHS